MANNKIETTLEAVNKVDYAILIEKSDIFPYENGKRTSDERIGVKLTVALQHNALSKLSIKFPNDPLPKIDNEAIEESLSELDFMLVQIPACKVTLYSTSSGIIMSATAEKAQIVEF